MTGTFGQFVTKRREQLGLSRRQLAMGAKISNTYVTNIEDYGQIPSPEVIRALSIPLKVPFVELLCRAEIITERDLESLPVDLDPELVDLFRELRDPRSEKALFMREGANATPEELREMLAAIQVWRAAKGLAKLPTDER